MHDIAAGLPGLGSTWHGGATPPTSYAGTVQLEGATAQFKDLGTNTSGQLEGVRTGLTKTCRFVRNVSGVTLNAKMLVAWKSGFEGQRIIGYARTTAAQVAGVVDEYLSAGLLNNDLGWITVAGPTLCTTSYTDVGVDFAQGTAVYAQTAAQSTSNTDSGRIAPWLGTFSAAEATNGGSGNILLNYIGRVMSAKSTNSTNAAILVNLTNLI